jgi:glutamate N-acetyltransferase/amino-acid N-acetyltransferase
VSVTQAQGFTAAGVAAGLKSSGAKDVSLVVNTGPKAASAAVFTTNKFAAAPVIWSRQIRLGGEARVVVLNSGGANACTGPPGFADTHATAELVAAGLTARKLGEFGAGEVFVCSTGLIGERLDMAALGKGIDLAISRLAPTGGVDAADAIMTTDTQRKISELRGDGYTIGGMAKGAGMLAPGMATMLSVITTDADIDSEFLQHALEFATSQTFDRLDSDGCMSTNDTVILLANAASGASPDPKEFQEALTRVCEDLAQQLMADAEGSTKEIHIEVTGASCESDAVQVGRSVSRSNLFKCAMFGEDPNWGRILSAVGTTSAIFAAYEVDVSINGVKICIGGGVGEDRSAVDLSQRRVDVLIDLHAGVHQAIIRTNDLSIGYVVENSEYST